MITDLGRGSNLPKSDNEISASKTEGRLISELVRSDLLLGETARTNSHRPHPVAVLGSLLDLLIERCPAYLLLCSTLLNL